MDLKRNASNAIIAAMADGYTLREMVELAMDDVDAPDHVCDALSVAHDELSVGYAMPKCQTPGCSNRAEARERDLCHGCEADGSHRALWGSGIPMSEHEPS